MRDSDIDSLSADGAQEALTDPRAALADRLEYHLVGGGLDTMDNPDWPDFAERLRDDLAERGVLLVTRSMLEGCLAEGIVDNALRRAVVAALKDQS